MRVVIQRVRHATVRVGSREVATIGQGLLVLLGVGRDDGVDDVRYIASKIQGLRLFEDEHGKINRSITDVGGEALIVSQFTLYGDCHHGRRPSFVRAAAGPLARELYDDVVRRLRASGLDVRTGEFQATMDVELVNTGPVTVLLDSRRDF
jgi:D-tyrosyl-tRNA(Tyr) deacylase